MIKNAKARSSIGLGVLFIALVGLLTGGVIVANAIVKTCVGSGTCNGTNSDDHITGNSYANTIYGMDGHDNIWGMDSSDDLNGGDDADFIDGNVGNDDIYGLYGNDHPDYLAYNGRPALLTGGNGNDTIRGNDGFDLVQGEAGVDDVYGGANNDNIYTFDCQPDTFSGGGGVTDVCQVDEGLDVGDGTCTVTHRYDCNP